MTADDLQQQRNNVTVPVPMPEVALKYIGQ